LEKEKIEERTEANSHELKKEKREMFSQKPKANGNNAVYVRSSGVETSVGINQ
jgi:hypothetical protein